MNGWQGWAIVICAGLVTLGVRASFIVLPPHTRVPTWLLDSLKYVAAAVLPALVAPDVLFRDAPVGETFNLYRIVAAAVATAFALKTRSVFGTLALGMAVLWLLKWWSPLG
ncbi:MAG: AzlD domain-containing protein [Betaproteobacteria bacterium]|nr:AzlD domain-containing protein [Betaproteobacteria bacterium]